MTIDHPENGGEDAPLDLRALDFDIESGADARFVTAVMTRTALAAAPPKIPLDPLYGLWSLPHRALIAASLLVALTAFGAVASARRNTSSSPATIAEATGVPSVFLSNGAGRP